MRPGKWKKCLFFCVVVFIFCLSNSWAYYSGLDIADDSDGYSIEVYKTTEVSNGLVLEFATNSTSWSQLDNNHVRVGWEGEHDWVFTEAFFETTRIMFGTPYTEMYINSRGNVEVFVNDAVRAALCLRLAAVREPMLVWLNKELIVRSFTGLGTAINPPIGTLLSAAFFEYGTLTFTESVEEGTQLVLALLPEVNKIIKRNVFLVYNGSLSSSSGDNDSFEPYDQNNPDEPYNPYITVVYQDPGDGNDPYYTDQDGDGYTPAQGDCNDQNSSTHPGAVDVCGDGIDQDCSGSDEQCSPDVHITHHHIRPYDTGSWHERVDTELGPGQSFYFHTQARVENRSNYDLEDVDIDYCVTTRKDFDIPHSERKRLDDDQVDIDAGDKENKTLRMSWVTLSTDMLSYTVATHDRHSFTFPITDEDRQKGEFTLYFYIDVETDDGGDRDVSSESKPDEYGKLTIQLPNLKLTNLFLGDEITFLSGTEIALKSWIVNGGIEVGSGVSFEWYISEGEGFDETAPSVGVHVISGNIIPRQIQFAEGLITLPTEPGIYTISAHIDSDNIFPEIDEEDNWQHRTFEVKSLNPYIFTSTETCANVTYNSSTWSHYVGTPKTTFTVGEEIWVLAELTDITVDHRLKIEVWVNGYHWWTEGENSSFTEVTGTLDRTYLHLGQDAEETGTFTFKTFIDVGNGWESLGEVSAVVEVAGTPPTEDYIFTSAQTCANVTYNSSTWSHYVGTPKTTFTVGEEIWVLAELTDITVNHRLKIEVWVNGYRWWTEGENSSFTEVTGTLNRTYVHLGQDAEETGTFTFKTFVDVGNGWESLGEVSATVQ